MGSGKPHLRRGIGATLVRYILDSVRVFFIILLSDAIALAQPSGASVVAGSAQVASPSGTLTTVTQTSAKAIINWQNFSVPAGSTVQFNQPNSSAITLNRVVGANASAVEGAINANGQVWLLNPNGILFGNGASINVGGLLATTSDIANQDFLGGNYNFSGGSGAVVNNGTIRTKKGGSAVLSAPNVTNNGLIAAKAGHVVLGGTDTFTVDFSRDHLLSYAVGAGHSGKVTNTGTITAPGGDVLLTARAAASVTDGVVNNTGMVEATSAREENGEIILDAVDGTATNSGTLDASGKGAGETGGSVQVLGQTVQVTDNAKIDVSGDAGGGEVLIGGNFHGAGPQQNAQTTTVGKAVINADAIRSGNGGKVAVWSNGTTQFDGNISAKGGAQSGNGGQVETSGHNLGVGADALVSTLAPNGVSGNWLLDPDSITIATCFSGCGNVSGGVPQQNYSTSGPLTIDPSTIVSALGSGNVTLQANDDITVTNAVVATSSNAFELDAGHSIILNAGIQNSGGSIILKANNPAGSGTGTDAAITGSGVLSASSIALSLALDGTGTGSIGSSGSPIQINSSSGLVSLSVFTSGANAFVSSATAVSIDNVANIGTNQGVDVVTGNFTLSAAGPISQTWGIYAGDLNVSNSGTGNTITLTDAGSYLTSDDGNVISGTARFNSLSNVSYTNANDGEAGYYTYLGNSTIGGNLTVQASYTNLTLADTSGTVDVTGSASLTSNVGDIAQTIPLSANGLITSTGNGGITLNNAANAISGTVTFHVPSDGGAGASFVNSVSTSIGTSSIGNGDFSVTSAGSLSVSGGIALGNGSLTLSAANGIAASSGVTLTATNVDFELSSATGNIGTSSIPINIASNSDSPIELTVNTPGASAFINATTDVDIAGVNLNQSFPTFPGNFSLTTTGNVTQNNGGIQAQDLTVSANTITLDQAGGNNEIFGTARFTSTSDLTYYNGSTPAETILGNSTVGGNLDVEAPGVLILSDSGGSVSVTGSAYLYGSSISQDAGFPIPIFAAGLSAAAASNISLDDGNNAASGTSAFQANGGVTFVNNGNTTLGRIANSDGGAIGAINVNVSSGTLTLTDNLVSSTSVTVGADTGITQTGGTLIAPTITLAGGTALVGSAGTPIQLDGGGGPVSLSVTSGTGAYLMSDIDVALNGVNVGAGPFGLIVTSGGITTQSSGTIVANTVSLEADSADIGTAGAPIEIAGTGPVSLSVFTLGGNAFIDTSASNAAVSIDNNSFVDEGSATGVNLNGGNFTLNAAGPVSQTWSISAADLNVSNSGAGNTITLTDGGNDLSGDYGNVITGAARFNSASDVSYTNPMDIDGYFDTLIGASTVGGNLTVNATETRLDLTDTAGSITVTGNTSLTSLSDIAEGRFNPDSGVLDTTQGIPLATAGLTVSSGRSITLTNANNAITGTIRLSNPGDGGVASSLTNNTATILGSTRITGGLTVVTTGTDSTLALADASGTQVVNVSGDVNLTASDDVSQSIPITATGTLNVTGTGSVALNNASNQISHLVTLYAPGDIAFTNAVDTTLGQVQKNSDSDPANSVTVTVVSGGSLTLTDEVTSSTFANLTADGDITSSGGQINANSAFLISNNGNIGSSIASPTPLPLFVNTVTASTGGGDIVLNLQPLSGTAITLGDGTHGINAGSGNVMLTSDGGSLVSSLASAGAITASTLSINAGDLDLEANNAVSGTINLSGGNVVFDNSVSTTLGTSSSASGNFTVASTGDLTLASGTIVTAGPGGTILLAATGNFINDEGADALSFPNGGVFQIYSSGLDGDTFGGLVSGNQAVWNTTYPTAISQSGSRYIFGGGQPSLTFTPGSLVKSYGTDDSASLVGNYTVSGFINASPYGNVFTQDSAANIINGTPAPQSAGSAASAGVAGSPYAITMSGFTLNNGYGYTVAPATITINPATLTYAANSASRLYGAADPAYSGTVTGFVNGDNQTTATSGTMVFTTPATASTGVGSYAINGSGLAANNYVFVQAGANATALTINPATLTYNAFTVSSVYDSGLPSFGGTVTGFANSETQATATTGTLSFTSPATATSNVGSYGVTGSGLTANNGNYVFAQAAGNATALTIDPGSLFYSADRANRVYGAANPAFTGTVIGFLGTDTLANATTGTLTFTSTATASSGVGSYAINGSGITVNNGNYNIVQDTGNATKLTITPATLTYAANSANRLYGAANPAFSGSVTGFVNGDTQSSATTGTLAFNSTATASTGVGSYAINGSGLSANNYVFTQASTNAADLTINPATLTYAANSANRLYGAANPAFSGSVMGFVNGDTQSSATTGTLAFNSTATASTGVGSYAINGSGLSANNYVFTQASTNAADLTINPATLTYAANSANRLYGAANPAFSGSVMGFVNGDTQTSATTGTLAFSSAATTATGVGSYAINGSGLSASNYVFTQAAANATDLTINPATLTVSLTGTVSKTFDGTTAATLSTANYTALGGVFGTDAVTLASFPNTGAYDTANIGTGKTVTVTGLSLAGASAGNYTIASSVSGAVGIILAANGSLPISPPVIGFEVSNGNPGQLPPVVPPPSFAPNNNGNLPGTPPLPPPPPPPPGPLADLTSPGGNPPSDTNSSDQTTNFVANSLNGGGSTSGGNNIIIPGLLNANAPPPLTVTDSGSLSSWGNDYLWW